MGSAALKPSPGIGKILRNRREELGLSLRDVSKRIAEIAGERFPSSTLARVEQGKVDPGVRRLHLLLKLYDLPIHLVSDVVDLEELAVREPTETDVEVLHRRGIEYWKQGDIPRALAHLFAIRTRTPRDEKTRSVRQKATLAFAIAARDLGKLRLARYLVDDLLCEPPEPRLLARVLILSSTIWRAVGSDVMALALLREAREHVNRRDSEQRAWIFHQEAKLRLERAELDEAQRAVDRAIALYRKRNDVHAQAKALLVRAGIFEARGNLNRAIQCARNATRLAERHEYELPAISGLIEAGRLNIVAGRVEPGVAELRRALARAVLVEDRLAQFHAHYHLFRAYRILGDRERERFELKSARHFLGFLDGEFAEAREMAAILDQVDPTPNRRNRRRTS